MTDPFLIVEMPVPVPERAAQVNLAEEIRQLMVRRGKLEAAIEVERQTNMKAQRDLLLGLLEVVDALDRIIQRGTSSDDPKQALERIRGNVESTRRLLSQKLQKEGVLRMDLVGKQLEPNLADIEGYQDRSELPDETIIRDIVTGYKWKDEVLRRAKVIVSQSL